MIFFKILKNLVLMDIVVVIIQAMEQIRIEIVHFQM